MCDYEVLNKINSPADVKKLNAAGCLVLRWLYSTRL